MKKIIYYILKVWFEYILNPMGPVVPIVMGGIITCLLTTPNSELPEPLNTIVKSKGVLIVIIMCFALLVTVYLYYYQKINEYKNEIRKLEIQNETNERNLNMSAGIILNKYGEFADFQRLNIFNDIFRRFVASTMDIECAQLYKYETYYENNNVVFKTNYVTGYLQENVKINGILQEYYYVNNDDYKRIKDIILLWKNLASEENNMYYEERKKLQKNFENEVQYLFAKLIDDLNKIDKYKKIQEIDFSKYLILNILLRFMSRSNEIITDAILLEKRKIEEYLSSAKRIGILGSILLQDNFIFEHKGASLKKGRVYSFEYLNIYEEDYIIIYSITQKAKDKDNIIDDLGKYSKKIKNMLIKDTI